MKNGIRAPKYGYKIWHVALIYVALEPAARFLKCTRKFCTYDVWITIKPSWSYLSSAYGLAYSNLNGITQQYGSLKSYDITGFAPTMTSWYSAIIYASAPSVTNIIIYSGDVFNTDVLRYHTHSEQTVLLDWAAIFLLISFSSSLNLWNVFFLTWKFFTFICRLCPTVLSVQEHVMTA